MKTKKCVDENVVIEIEVIAVKRRKTVLDFVLNTIKEVLQIEADSENFWKCIMIEYIICTRVLIKLVWRTRWENKSDKNVDVGWYFVQISSTSEHFTVFNLKKSSTSVHSLNFHLKNEKNIFHLWVQLKNHFIKFHSPLTLTFYFQLSLHQHTKKVHETDLVRTERHKNSTKEKVTNKKKAREKNSVIESRKRWKNYLSCCVFLLCFYCRAKKCRTFFLLFANAPNFTRTKNWVKQRSERGSNEKTTRN